MPVSGLDSGLHLPLNSMTGAGNNTTSEQGT